MLELRIVREFERCGVPLLVVSRRLETAAEIFGADYPFTTRRFVTDGAPGAMDLRGHYWISSLNRLAAGLLITCDQQSDGQGMRRLV